MNSEYVLEAEQTAIQYMNGLGWVGKKEKLRLSSTFWDMKNRMSEWLYVVKRSRVGGETKNSVLKVFSLTYLLDWGLGYELKLKRRN